MAIVFWFSSSLSLSTVVVLLLLVLCQVSDCHAAVDRDSPEELLKALSPKEADEIARDAFAHILERLYEKKDNDDDNSQNQGRSLQYTDPPTPSVIPECNTVIDIITAEELREEAKSEFGKQGVEGLRMWALDNVVLQQIDHDLQIWKICGRCSDFVGAFARSKFAPVACRKDDYGYDALHSGLLIAPYDSSRQQFFDTTLPVNIIAPAAGSVASEAWSRPIRDPQVLIGSFVSSSSRVYTIMPDYTGFGESKDYHRAFLIRQSIITATIPLIWQAEAIVARESDCTAAMADSFTIFGYSEGGYGAVAIANALGRMYMGKNPVISMHAGGGPYQISTITMLDAVQKIQTGWYEMSFFMALVGGGLSSTVTSVANYEQGQDFFAADAREALIEVVQNARVDRQPIYDLIPVDDPFSVYNDGIVELYQRALIEGNDDPCANITASTSLGVDKLCRALQDQDLGHVLLTAEYPMYLCHSHEDQLVPYENVPWVALNPDYLHVNTVSGRHTPAAIPCVINTAWYFINPNNVKNYPVVDKTKEGGCQAKLELEPEDDSVEDDSVGGPCSLAIFRWIPLC